MLIFVAVVLIGVPLYWIVLPGRRPTPTHEHSIQSPPGLLPLGGESQ
ncbi:hypothetical protein [Paenibacillus illinoisensis]|nr:hypothetical protein [Paenibacillus illinoisensis]MBM6386243.1 hypothetical protein [Paenibacillus sp.]MBY0216005.1 hypothetical protein [Paenibacillus illinoisensis]MCM3204167.1 hypothetical protein [Paenibacillus illinoisensis]